MNELTEVCFMKALHNPVKKYTAGAFLFHTLIHLEFSYLASLESLRYGGSTFNGTMSSGVSILHGGLGIIALLMAIAHYTTTLRTNTLKIWGVIHVSVLLLQITALIHAALTTLSYQSVFLAYLLPILILLIPPVLIMILATWESSYEHQGGTIGELWWSKEEPT